MKKSNLKNLLLLLVNRVVLVFSILIISSTSSNATHISAGNITYKSIGNGNFIVRLTLYRDCAGNPISTVFNLDITSQGGCSAPLVVELSQIPNTGQQLPVSTCVPQANCYEEYIYEDTVNLPGCSDWILSFHTCCRNFPNNVVSQNYDDFYISTVLDNSNFPGNNSPVFNNAPIGTFCVNKDFQFDMGATDPDGDQLIYSLDSSLGLLTGAPTPTSLVYNMPNTFSNPIPTTPSTAFGINSNTGIISLNPSSIGNFVLCIRVDEYDPSGQFKGSVKRDLQVNVSAMCNSNIPTVDAVVLTNGISANCGDTTITIPLSANIQCGSVASDGSDFIINSGTSILPVAYAEGQNCVIGLSNSVTLHFPSPLNGGLYTITIHNGIDGNTLLSECGVPMDSLTQIQVNVNGSLVLNLITTNLNCNGNNSGSITASTTGLPGSFLYSLDGVNFTASNSFQNLSAGAYTLYSKSSGNCITSQTVTLTEPTLLNISESSTNVSCYGFQNGASSLAITGGTHPYTIDWNTSPVQNGMTAVNLPAGSYHAIVSDANGCSAIQQVVISQPDSIQFTVSGATTLCIGQQATLNSSATGGTGQLIYTWNQSFFGPVQIVSPQQTTVYQLSVTDSNGCHSPVQSLTVTVNPVLSLTANVPLPVCEGSTVSLHVITTGGNGGPYTYAWSNGSTATGQLIVTPSAPSTYTVTVTDGCTTPAIANQFDVFVNPKPIIAFTADTTIDCYPLVSHFENQSTINSGTIATWDWKFGDGSVSNEIHPGHTYTEAGKYTVSLHAISDKGCESTLVVPDFIRVKPALKPTAAFSYHPDQVTTNNPLVSFTNKSTKDAVYNWYFGDGTGQSQLQHPTYTYTDSGHFVVELLVTNSEGCSATIQHTLEILPAPALFMPTAFSPNGDGLNDNLAALGEFITEFNLLIFNRWGQKVFETENLTSGWNGNYNGEPAPAGIYSYIINARGFDRKTMVTDGNFVLLR